MPADRIKVLPNVPSAVGMKHPYDCPLDKNGSEWPLDSFTCRRLADESIRRFEVEPDAPAAEAEAAEPVADAASRAPAEAAPAAEPPVA